MPQTALIRVVLPAPLGPRRAKISPRCISKSIPTRALNPFSKVLFSDKIVIALDINGPHDTPRAPSYRINDEAEEGAQEIMAVAKSTAAARRINRYDVMLL